MFSGSKQGFRTLLLSVIFTAWAAGTAGLVLANGSLRWTVPLIAVIVSAAIYVKYQRVSFGDRTGQRVRSGEPPQSDPARVQSLADKLIGHFDARDAEYFAQLLIQPSKRMLRIADHIEPSSRSYGLRTTYNVSIPESLAKKPVCIALLVAPKGTLLNGLSVVGPNGSRYSTLSQSATIAYTYATVNRIVEGALSPSAFNVYKSNVQPHLLSLLCRHSVTRGTDPFLLSVVSQLGQLAHSRRRRLKLGLAVAIIKQSTSSYPLCVVEQDPQSHGVADLLVNEVRVRFVVSRRIIPTVRYDKRTNFAKTRDTLRSAFGIRPPAVQVPLFNAGRANSYHLEFAGPEGTYLAEQDILEPDGSVANLQGVQYRMQGRYWQRYAHLYIHNFQPRQAAPWVYACKFVERTPGSIGQATLSSLAALVLISVCAFARLSQRFDSPSDLVAVLLAVPAIFATWAGFERTSQQLVGQLKSRLSQMITAVTSICAAAYYVLGPRPVDEDFVSAIWDRPGAALWIVLAAAAIFNFVSTAASWQIQTSIQRYFIDRDLPSP